MVQRRQKQSPKPRLGIQAVIRVVKRTAKPRAHDSTPVAAAGRPDGEDTAAAPVGAGAWHGRKRCHEAKNRQACCQKGPLDGRTVSDPSEHNNTMRSHGAFLHFQIAVTGFASGAAPPETVPRGRDSASRPPYGSCRGLPSLGPMAASQQLWQVGRTAMILHPHLSEWSDRFGPKVVP